MWVRGHITRSWGENYKQLRYLQDPIRGAQEQEWRKQGYYNTRQYGEMYGYPNEMPLWAEFIASELKLFQCGFVIYRMKTLDIMPMHTDHYKKYCEVFNTNPNEVWRAIVFLEDWKSGHYFEIDEEAIVNWQAGDFIMWQGDVPHAASNIGIEDRYTLQITGQK